MCVSASIRTFADAASSAACAAVEWRVSAARSASSSMKVASCTSRSASQARSRVAGEDDLAAAPGLAHHLARLDAVHRLALLEPPEVRAGPHAELARPLR